MVTRVSATDAVRAFSDLLNRIRYRREEFLVERGGEAICRMTPAGPLEMTLGQLAALLRGLPIPDPAFARDVRDAVKGHGEATAIDVGALIDSSVLVAAERQTLDLGHLLTGRSWRPRRSTPATA